MSAQLPQGIVTVLFTDVEGSTDLSGRLGEDAAQRLLNQQVEAVRACVRAGSGHEVKSLGDGLMCVFGSVKGAVSCAVDIQRAVAEMNRERPEGERVRIRIGLNTGEVIHQDGDIFGDVVNGAARVAAKAKGGQILISDAVKAVMGRQADHEIVDRGRYRLKGFEERWRLHEVAWERALEASLPEQSPFVGRDREREDARGLLAAAKEGKGGVVLIGGEAGVGKTRLASEIMREAVANGFIALTGRCYESEGATPYTPFLEMLEAACRTFPAEAMRVALGDSAPEVAKLMPELRRVFPDIPPAPELPPEQERRYAFNGVREFVGRAAAGTPLLMVIDDLHWADESTLLLLRHLSSHLDGMAVLVLATYRDMEVGPVLGQLLDELVRRREGWLLSLKRLPKEAVRSILSGLLGQDAPQSLVDLVFGQTEGNAFFVEEVLKHLREEGRLYGADGRVRSDFKSEEVDVPEGVRLVIGWRLLRLSEECRKTLSLAAVIGRGFSFELLEASGDIEGDDLLDVIDEAEQAQLIHEVDGDPRTPFVFAHELIRQTLLTLLSAVRRQRMHLRVADAMEALHGTGMAEYAADVAHHLLSAGPAAAADRTVVYLTTAGERAVDAAAFEDGERFFAAALSLMGDQKGAARADLLFKRGWALRSTARWDEALVVWRESFALYEELSDSASVARIAADITQQLLWDAKFFEAMEIVRRGLSAGVEVPKVDRCRLLAAGALVLSAAGSHAASADMIDEALGLANEIGDRRLLGQVLGYKCTHHWCFTQAELCAESGEEASRLCRETGDIWYLTTILGFVIQGHLFAGRLDDVARVIEELRPLAESLGHVGTKLNLLRAGGESEFVSSGDIGTYHDSSQADLEFCLEAELPWVSVAYTRVAVAEFWQGRWEEAVELARQGVSREPPGFWTGIDSGRLALLLAYSGMYEECVSTLEAAGLNATVDRPLTAGMQSVVMCAIEAFALAGDRKRAGSLRTRLELADPTAKLFPASSQLVEAVRGISAACTGDVAAARGHFEAALRQSREIPHRIAEAETERWYGWALKAAGETAEARPHLERAIELYAKFGMPRHVELTRALLREEGRDDICESA